MFKWILRLLGHQVHLVMILLMPLISVGMLLVSVHLATSTTTGKAFLVDFLNDLFAGTFHIEELRWESDPHDLHLYGVQLDDPKGARVASIPHVHAQIDLSSLLLLKIRTEGIDVYDPDVRLDFTDGLNLANAFTTAPGRIPLEPEEPSGGGLSLILDGINLHDGVANLNFGDFTVGMETIQIEGFRFELGSRLDMQARALRTPRINASFKPEMFGKSSKVDPENPDVPPAGPLKLVVRDLTLEQWWWFGEGFRFGLCEGDVSGAKLRISDALLDLGAGAIFDWQAKIGMKLPPGFEGVSYFTGPLIESGMDIELFGRGHLGTEMNADSHLQLDVSVNASPLRLSGLTFDTAKLDLRLVNRHLYIRGLDLTGYGATIGLGGEAREPWPFWSGPARNPPRMDERAYIALLDWDYHMPLEIRGLNMEALVADLAPELDQPVLDEANGTADITLDASGRLLDAEDRERRTPMAAFHRVRLEKLDILRDPTRGSLPTRRVRLDGTLVFRQGVLSSEGSLPLRLDNDRITLKHLTLDLLDPKLDASTEVDIALQRLETYLGRFGLKDIKGGVRAGFKLDGPLLEPLIRDGRVVLTQPNLFGIQARQVLANFGLRDGTLALSTLEVDGEATMLKASGAIGLFDGPLTQVRTNPSLDVVVERSRVNIGPLLQSLKVDVPVNGVVRLDRSKIKGTARQPQIIGHVEGERLDVFGERLNKVVADVNIDTTAATVKNLEVRHGKNGLLQAKLDWKYTGRIDAHITGKDFFLQEFNAVKPIGLRGELRHLNMDLVGALDVRKLRTTGRSVTGAPATSPGDIIRWLTTQGLDFNGTIALWNTRFQARKLGQLTAHWDTLKREGAMAADPDVECPGSQVTMMDVTWLPHVPDVGRTPLVRGSGNDNTTAAFTATDKWSDVTGVRRIVPAFVNTRLCVPMVAKPRDGSERAKADAITDEITASINFSDLNVRGVVASYLQPSIVAERAAMRRSRRTSALGLQIASNIGAKAAAARAREQKRDPQPYLDQIKPVAWDPKSGELANAKTPLEESLSLWNSTVMTGRADAYISRADMSLGASLLLDKLAVRVLGQTLANRDPIEAGFDGRTLKLGDVTLGADGRYVKLTGLVNAESADILLKGDLDLRLFNLLPSVVTNIRGSVGVDLKLKGRWDDSPKPVGQVVFSDRVSLRVRALGKNVDFDKGRIILEANRVVIPDLQFQFLEGKAQVDGEVELIDYTPGKIDLHLRTQNMSYRVPSTANVTFNSDLTARIGALADPKTWRLDGEITLVEGLFYQSMEFLTGETVGRFSGAIGRGRTSRYQQSVFEQLPWLNDVAFNVKLIGRDGFFVRTEVQTVTTDLELKLNLRAVKEHIDPLLEFSLNGAVGILPGGSIVFQGQPFQVREGSIVWKGPLATPAITFVAETDIQSACNEVDTGADPNATLDDVGAGTNVEAQIYHIVMNIDGSLDNLEELNAEFTSTPYVDWRSITTLILTRCTADQLSSSAALDPALALALQPLLKQVAQAAQGYIPISEISITSGVGSTTISLSERVNNRLVLDYDTVFGSGNASEQRFSARLLLSDDLSFNVSGRDTQTTFIGTGKLQLRIPLE